MNLSRKARREVLLILSFMGVFALAYLLIFGPGGFIHLQTVQENFEDLSIQNRRLNENLQRQQSEIEMINTDEDELERVTREKLDYARPGEVIITLPATQ